MHQFPTTVPGIPSTRAHRRASSPPTVPPVSMCVLAFTLMLFCVGNAQAKVAYVIVGGQSLSFSPPTIDIDAGDTVTFLNLGGLHNVVADDGAFRCARGCDNDGHGGSGAASSQLWLVSINFPNAGAVGYFCEVHGAPGVGMSGTINVLGAPPPPLASAVPTAGTWFLALLGAAFIACAAPWLRRARARGKNCPRD